MSWMVTNLETGEVREFFDKKNAEKLRLFGNYEVLPAAEYLGRLNKETSKKEMEWRQNQHKVAIASVMERVKKRNEL